MKNLTRYTLLYFLCLSTLTMAQSGSDVCPLAIGSEFPEAQVHDGDGNEVDLQALVDTLPTVLIVYRGAWCGYCTAHLAELNDISPQIESLGYQALGLTIDQPDRLEESYAKSDQEITVYSDSDLDVIEALGLNWKVSDEKYSLYKEKYSLDLESWSGQTHHNLPVPAIYIIKEGKVVFHYVNPDYSTRLAPETLLAILPTL